MLIMIPALGNTSVSFSKKGGSLLAYESLVQKMRFEGRIGLKKLSAQPQSSLITNPLQFNLTNLTQKGRNRLFDVVTGCDALFAIYNLL